MIANKKTKRMCGYYEHRTCACFINKEFAVWYDDDESVGSRVIEA